MKLDTELIKNYKPNCAISSELLKDSQEYRVLATIRYLFPFEFDEMIPDESPDLQDRKNDIGIEVTVATSQKDMEASRVFAEYKAGSRSEENFNKIIKRNGYEIEDSYINGAKIISKSGKLECEKCVFEKAIENKLKKLPDYRKKFNKVGLAILLTEIPTSDLENSIVDKISELNNNNNNEDFFDFIFIISNRFCLRYDIKTNKIVKYSLTAQESDSLKIIGRLSAEKTIDLSNIEYTGH